MEIVKFGNEDVIATSIGFTLRKFGNGIANDATVQIGSGQEYSIEGMGGWGNKGQFYDKIADKLSDLGYVINGGNAQGLRFYTVSDPANTGYGLEAALSKDNNPDYNTDRGDASWNGYYLYNLNNQRFEKVRNIN